MGGSDSSGKFAIIQSNENGRGSSAQNDIANRWGIQDPFRLFQIPVELGLRVLSGMEALEYQGRQFVAYPHEKIR